MDPPISPAYARSIAMAVACSLGTITSLRASRETRAAEAARKRVVTASRRGTTARDALRYRNERSAPGPVERLNDIAERNRCPLNGIQSSHTYRGRGDTPS